LEELEEELIEEEEELEELEVRKFYQYF